LRDAGLGACSHIIGTLNDADEIRVWRNAKSALAVRHLRDTARVRLGD